MRADEKFCIGDRVRMSDSGLRVWSRGSRRGRVVQTGVVVGFSDITSLVTIRQDGRASRQAWHMDYWERA